MTLTLGLIALVPIIAGLLAWNEKRRPTEVLYFEVLEDEDWAWPDFEDFETK